MVRPRFLDEVGVFYTVVVAVLVVVTVAAYSIIAVTA
jgi:hypothetical protein